MRINKQFSHETKKVGPIGESVICPFFVGGEVLQKRWSLDATPAVNQYLQAETRLKHFSVSKAGYLLEHFCNFVALKVTLSKTKLCGL